MRILIVARDFLPTTGGAQTYAHLLAEGLVQAGHTVTVLSETPSDQEYDRTLSYPVVRQASFVQVWRLIGRCDVLQLAGPVFIPLLFGICRGTPTFIEHHGYQAACPNGMLFYEPSTSACPEHFLARRYHKCLKCNAKSQGWLKSLRMLLATFPHRWLSQLATVNAPISKHVDERLRLRRSQVIYYGVHEPSSAAPWANTSRTPLSPAILAYVGRLSPEKGLPVAVEAVARLKLRGIDTRLKIVGDGPERASLEALARRRGVGSQVCFLGFLHGREMEEALADVVALMMPTISEETAGLAAIEQMMRGRVVIASDIGGLGEVVDGAGLKFPAGDAEALAGCIERLIDEPALASELGGKARERAQKLFGYERMIEEHLQLYRKILGSGA